MDRNGSLPFNKGKSLEGLEFNGRVGFLSSGFSSVILVVQVSDIVLGDGL